MRFSKKKMLLTLVLLMGLGVSALQATPVVSLQLTDGSNTVTISDNGAGDTNAAIGAVTFSGALGSWFVNVSTGQGSLVLGGPNSGTMNLNSINISGPGAGILSILFTQTDNSFAYPGWALQFGGTASGVVSAAYDAFVDSGNGAFAMTTGFGSVVGGNGAFSGTASGTAPGLTGLYSLTQRIQIQSTGATSSVFSGSADLTPLPEPNSILLLSVGLIGAASLMGFRKLKPSVAATRSRG